MVDVTCLVVLSKDIEADGLWLDGSGVRAFTCFCNLASCFFIFEDAGLKMLVSKVCLGRYSFWKKLLACENIVDVGSDLLASLGTNVKWSDALYFSSEDVCWLIIPFLRTVR